MSWAADKAFAFLKTRCGHNKVLNTQALERGFTVADRLRPSGSPRDVSKTR
jgi:hypothetical protein